MPSRQGLRSFGSEPALARFLARITEVQRQERLRAERAQKQRERESKQRLARLVAARTRLEQKREKQRTLRFDGQIARLDEQIMVYGAVTEYLSVSSAATTTSKPPSVTNVQEAGVDEGGLVKRHGDHLVILRRGRLFTVEIAGNDLRPVAAIDAFDPRLDADSNDGATWYDELLVSGNTIAVIGFSYARGGTEIGLFGIDAAGGLRHRGTYHLRSNDYYSRDNYSSRLIGSTLILYTSSWFQAEGTGATGFPELRKWSPSATDDQYQRITSSSRVYQPAQLPRNTSRVMLHTVTTCDLAKPELTCEATVVIGGPQRAFYVSRSAVYIWTGEFGRAYTDPRSIVYRMPFDGSAPTALRARGTPSDQFSFLESDDGFLNVVLRSAMADARASHGLDGDLSLLRVPLAQLADGSTSAPSSSYHPLGDCESGNVENRFVGPFVLVSCATHASRNGDPVESSLKVVRWATQEILQLDLPLWPLRIDPMGDHALIVGTTREDWSDMRFATIRLDGLPTVADMFSLTGTSLRQQRSQAFGYRPENATDGLLGLPVFHEADSNDTNRDGSSAILFLHSRSLMLEDAGQLASGPQPSDDACRASCVDWYGDARPLFIGDRAFALLGYELVEGTLADGRVLEVRRTSFAPPVTSFSSH